MLGRGRVRAAAFRRDVYRIFLALTRLVIDPLVAGQPPGATYQDLASGASLDLTD